MKKKCKEIEENKEWERLEISSRKLVISRDCNNGNNKGQKEQGPKRSRRN